MEMKKISVLFMIFILIFMAGCDIYTGKEENSKPVVAVTIVPQKTFIKAVAGDLVEVTDMIPAGNSPANYAPSPKEMRGLSQASIYFSIGVPAEQANILPKINDINKNIKVVDLADRVDQVYPDREFSPGERDPHIWLSPKRVKVMIDIIAQELSGIDPENSGIYEKNAERYKKQLDKMDDYIEETLSSLKHRAFIVYHPAFGYFADDYNMEMIAVEEDGKEATARRLQQIIDVAKEKQIKVIFYQAEIDSQQSETLAQEIGGRTQKIEPLAEDYLENLASMADTFKDVLQGE